tara:strand:- start:104 stop:1120 length:1017 start_codon:yes stop_codon:yes gene_type:complete
MTTSTIRTLIPFTDDNYAELVSHPVFAALVADTPQFDGLTNGRFEIVDMTKVNVEEEDNSARAGGTRLKEKDLDKGWDVTQKPLIIVWFNGEMWLWDGFNRWIKLDSMGMITAPAWVYDLKDSYNFYDVKDIVQLSANDHPNSDEATRQDFINTGVGWAKRHQIDDLNTIRSWVMKSSHQFKEKDVDKIASSILVASEVKNIRHISTGSQAKKEAFDFLDVDLTYSGKKVKNPIVICTRADGYIQDAFMLHMKKFVQDEGDLETTQLVGYTKGCETEEDVIKQRQDAKDKFDELDQLICKYAYLKSQLNGKTPYEWEGFLPQLFGKETGRGITEGLVD